ncbi:FkbM family methyltransferase [Alphaproteobacteria bacterium]|nr:FkbM family methyltransferase [Alphaproteobacteria bacterium]
MILQPPVPDWKNKLIAFCQRRPTNWLGRRMALLGRKLAMKGLPVPVEAQVEGINVKLHLRDNICERRFLFMPQFFDQEERGLIADRLPDDGVFVDIGANVGFYSLRASQILGASGTILAIEPNPVTFDRLRTNFSMNDVKATVILEQIGVGEGEGELELVLHPDNLGEASAFAEFAGEKIKVPSRSLNQVLDLHGIERIDVLKIDIEGFEDVALMPFLRSNSSARLPKTIVIEKSEDRWRSDLLGQLMSLGYRHGISTKNNHVFFFDSEGD